MLTRTQTATLLLLAVLVWILALLFYGTIKWPLNRADVWSYFKPFGTVGGLLGLFLLAFDKVAWKWRLFRGWLVNRPNIRGTWKLELRSSWVDPDTGERVAPIEGFISIFQTYSKLNLRLMTKESSSDCIATEVIKRQDDTFQIAAVYSNTPKAEVRDRSEIHHGGMLLTVDGDPPTRIEGNYWTSRKTIGDLILTERKKMLYQTYESARNMHFAGTS